MSKATTLTVSHNIWLTREQRYKLQEGRAVETVGVSVPVWFFRGSTSEPANEIFAKYLLTSELTPLALGHMTDGYHINIPPIIVPPGVPVDLWESMSESDREQWASKNGGTSLKVSSLKDYKDGGSEWLFFRQYSKLMRKSDNAPVHLLHYVEIKDMKELTETMS